VKPSERNSGSEGSAPQSAKIPRGDLDNAARPEAASVYGPGQSAGVRTPLGDPVRDERRTHGMRRFVIYEVGLVTPYTPEDEERKSIPVRLWHDDARGGTLLEVGLYTFCRDDLRVLCAAIKGWVMSDYRSLLRRAQREAPEQPDAAGRPGARRLSGAGSRGLSRRSAFREETP
jgi:hypothetical protein